MKKSVIGIMFLLVLLSFSLFGCTRTISNTSSSNTSKSVSSSLNQTSSSLTSSESLGSSVTENSSSLASSSTSNLSSNGSSLVQDKFTVYIESSIVNGSVNANKQEVERGGSVLVTVSPNNGYVLNSLIINGSSVTVENNSYLIENVTTNVIIGATFRESIVEVSLQTSFYELKTMPSDMTVSQISISPTILVDGEYKDVSYFDTFVLQPNNDGVVIVDGLNITGDNVCGATTTVDVVANGKKYASFKVEVNNYKGSGYSEITTSEQLKTITSSGKYVLGNDINLDGCGWWDPTTYKTLVPTFSGILDGNGHKISNCWLAGGEVGQSFIGELTGKITNVAFCGFYSAYVPVSTGFIGSCKGTLDNVYLDFILYRDGSNSQNGGTLVGTLENNSTIKNCIINLTQHSSIKNTIMSNYGVFGSVANTNIVNIENTYIITNGITFTKNMFATENVVGANKAIKNQLKIYNSVGILSTLSEINDFNKFWQFSSNGITFGNTLLTPSVTTISSKSEFVSKISENPSGKFVLTCDIDFQNEYLSLDGTSVITDTFSGELDGNGYQIKNFKILEGWNKGFCTYLTGTIKNVAFINCLSTQSYYDNGLVGFVQNGGVMENVYLDYVMQQPTSGSAYCGTLAGILGENGTIKNCIVNVRTNAYGLNTTVYGALVGRVYNSNSKIENSYAILNGVKLDTEFNSLVAWEVSDNIYQSITSNADVLDYYSDFLSRANINAFDDLWSFGLYGITFGGQLLVEEQNYLFNNGITEYKLVYPSNATSLELFAVEEFKLFFLKATGCEITAITDAGLVWGDNSKYISIGNTTIKNNCGTQFIREELTASGYKILSKGSVIIVAGAEEEGSLYGTYKLMNTMFGFRAYADDEIFYNEVDKIPLYEYSITEIPAFEERQLGYYYSTYISGSATYRRRLHITAHGENWIYATHSHFKIMPKETYYATHQDWYSPSGTQLCLTNTAMREEFIKNVKKVVEANPNSEWILLGLEDNGGFCNCANCTSAISKYGSASGVDMVFVNYVAQEIESWLKQTNPTRVLKIGTFAYQSTFAPPATYNSATGTWSPNCPEVVARDNVFVFFAPLYANFSYSFFDENNKEIGDSIKGWQSVVNNFAVWTYAQNYLDYFAFFNNPNTLATHYREFEAIGVQSIIDLGSWDTGSPNFQKMRIYISSRLMWNPTLKYEDLADEFMRIYYKDAYPYIKEYYLRMREHTDWIRSTYGIDATCYNDLRDAKYWPKEYLMECNAIFDKALQSIAPLESTDKTLYDTLANRIKLEKLAVDFYMVDFYQGDFSVEEQNNMIDEVVLVAEQNEVLYWFEHLNNSMPYNCKITDIANEWRAKI